MSSASDFSLPFCGAGRLWITFVGQEKPQDFIPTTALIFITKALITLLKNS